ncbi:conserved membrane hypothetical protein [Hyella patelloides LEGE 07179]|uniref:Uncharacterized protein n=1 Tax=Hyella patelloides LEGE 07179 TaxID=945734 RepID=A0A563VUN0_9CYAN|nr:hypothetical protein [Hyella patelloides]VEP15182.1 conserved membrane hypothetical protein [Hyella patelloides LEGE 07179]
MNSIIPLYLSLTIALASGSLFLHLLPRLGKPGKQFSDTLCHAPGIDVVLFYFMILPLIFGALVDGGRGLGVALIAQLSTFWIWIAAHELIYYKSRKEPKIFPTLSRIVGGWRNHLAVWITLLALPCFWTVRFAEVVAYPPLTWLVGFPKYQAKDWVNVSRHKFEGLIGYDLIWCLYCDWMTGVWSLGTEMLRNVESFWCPIRFYDDKKCENCKIDFPDVDGAWVKSDRNMKDVTELLDCKYSQVKERSWFGHKSRQ